MPKEQRIICAMIGKANSGKTTLLYKLKNKDTSAITPTIAASFITHTLNTNDCSTTLEIWDVAGAEQYSATSQIYISQAQVLILTIDLSTYKDVETIKKEVAALITTYHLPLIAANKPILLALTKADLVSDSEQITQALTADQAFLNQYGMRKVIATSAENGKNIDTLFTDAAGLLINHPKAVYSKHQVTYPSDNNHSHIAFTISFYILLGVLFTGVGIPPFLYLHLSLLVTAMLITAIATLIVAMIGGLIAAELTKECTIYISHYNSLDSNTQQTLNQNLGSKNQQLFSGYSSTVFVKANPTNEKKDDGQPLSPHANTLEFKKT